MASLADKEYRDALVNEFINQGVAFQIRAIRNMRGWTQQTLGENCGKAQSEISRFEDPDYEGYTPKTLTKLASAFDVALQIKFIPFSELVDEMSDATRTFEVSPYPDGECLRNHEAQRPATTRPATAHSAPA